jgi:hypothetical protein
MCGRLISEKDHPPKDEQRRCPELAELFTAARISCRPWQRGRVKILSPRQCKQDLALGHVYIRTRKSRSGIEHGEKIRLPQFWCKVTGNRQGPETWSAWENPRSVGCFLGFQIVFFFFMNKYETFEGRSFLLDISLLYPTAMRSPWCQSCNAFLTIDVASGQSQP